MRKRPILSLPCLRVHSYCLILIVALFLGLVCNSVVLVSAQTLHRNHNEYDINNRRREKREYSHKEYVYQQNYQKHQQYHQQRRSHEKSKSESQEEGKYNFDFESLYDIYKGSIAGKPPRHILQGTTKGLASSFLGIFSGLPFLFGLPLAFSKSDSLQGWPGVIVGLIFGSITSLFTAATGITVGLYQFSIGVWNTPLACMSFFSKERIWDPIQNKWAHYVLDEEVQTYIQQNSSFQDKVSDNTYYDLLGVKPGATTKEIKKGYYTKAKDIHPDKNTNNEEAAAIFIQIHEAYETLIDPDKRKQYDTFGRKSSSSSSSSSASDILESFNVAIFFEILFGSQPVEPYVGQLAVSSFFTNVFKLIQVCNSDSTITSESIMNFFAGSKQQTLQRPVQVALHLRDFIKPIVSRRVTEQEFSVLCQKEADKLANNNSFGDRFLFHIGNALIQEADLFLSQSWYGWPLHIFQSTNKSIHGMKHKFNGFKKIIELFSEFIEKLDTSMNLDEEDDQKLFSEWQKYFSNMKLQVNKQTIEDKLPLIIEMAWEYNAWDIAKLLENACAKVFFDAKTNSFGERKRRAQALRTLGQVFVKRSRYNVNEEPDDSIVQDMKVRAEVALQFAQQNLKKSNSESEEIIKNAKKREKRQ